MLMLWLDVTSVVGTLNGVYLILRDDDDYFCKCCEVSCAIFVGRREASACLIMLSTKQCSHWYHFNAFGMARPGFEPTTSRFRSGCSTTEPPGPVISIPDSSGEEANFFVTLLAEGI